MKKLTPECAAVCKAALAALSKIEPDGMTKDTMLYMAQMGVGHPLLSQEKEAAFFTMREREWIISHTNPVTDLETWAITVNGQNALMVL